MINCDMKASTNKAIKVIPVIIVLIIFAVINYLNRKDYYDAIVDSTGLIFEDFDQKVVKENEEAAEGRVEYMSIIDSIKESYFGENSTESESTEESPSYLEHELNLHALSALLMDASNNRVLYEKNGFNRMSMASTTKIMTCIVTLENADLNGLVTVSSYAAGMPDVQLNIRKGEQYYLKDLLYSLMLESHNDSAVAIAEYVGGSVEGFAIMMNDKARELGCENTNFITPNGLDAEGHYTTARDLAVIAAYAIKNDQFVKITNTSSHTFKEVKRGRTLLVSNKNRFLYMMEGAIGVKTGFTNDAGYCFVGAIKRTDMTLISVVLGCGWPPNKNLKWRDTKELMSFGLDNYELKKIYKPINFEPVAVKDGQQRFEPLTMEGDLTLLMRDDESVKIVYNIPHMLQAPVKADVVVGKASYYINGLLYAELPIYTTQDIKKIDFEFCLQKILKMWTLQQ